jgi:ABC-type cobalamin/Fe3+-siderophores transport system ATPase subunit
VPVSWFGGIYKDAKPENFFAQFGTDPDEFFKVFRDMEIPEEQRTAKDFHKTIVMVTHDPHAASYAHVTRHLEKGMLLPPG